MTTKEYLQNVLDSQALSDDSEELKTLRARRKDVERLLRKSFGSVPTIRYGGSKAKGTMNRDGFDLDMTCYFPHDSAVAGETLEEIYDTVAVTLEEKYTVERKGSALRLKGKDVGELGVDFHIDVVPGRYVDDSNTDTFLYRSTGEKKRLKTNLDVHIAHVKDSGVLDAIRLMKLWNVRNVVAVKTFVLELAVIKLLSGKKGKSLEKQLLNVWQALRDDVESLGVEDPANSNNDLKPLLDSVRWQLSSVAASTLTTIDTLGWEAVFGKVAVEESETDKCAAIVGAAAAVSRPTRPYCSEE